MALPEAGKSRLARILLPTGIAMILGGAALAASVEPWWIGALVSGAGAMDLLVALVVTRVVGKPR